ncbi:MAG: hypothetical protein ABWY46_10760, partial [Pseudomonas sp.]
ERRLRQLLQGVGVFKRLAGFAEASPLSGSKLPRHGGWFPTRFSEGKIKRLWLSAANTLIGWPETTKPRIIGALSF